MSQHDMDVANGPGLTVRADINGALQALASNNVGATAPATTFPCQWWGDTTTSKLKRRNSANSAWIDMGPLDSLSYLLASGGTLTGPINDATPQTIASATTTDIGAATSNVVYISGTTTITGLGTIAAGARRTVRFLGSLVLTYNVTSLILPAAVNITTAANDTAEFVSLGSGNWLCLRYNPASGTYGRTNIVGTVSQASGVPTGAIVESGSNANGTYTKYADGTMICKQDISVSASWAITSAIGSLFYNSSPLALSYAINFAAVPIVSMTLSTVGGAQWLFIGTAATTSSTPGCFTISAVSITTGIRLSYIAIGRWF
ncbi:hypothetical protein [Pseudomonas hormoni]